MDFVIGQSLNSSCEYHANGWDPNLNAQCRVLSEWIETSKSALLRDLFSKFPYNLKVAAAYEIDKSSGLFEENFQIPPSKSIDESVTWRKMGNEALGNNDYAKALDCYTECIASAPKNSRELALGYANRSLILIKLKNFDIALLDVNRALNGDYPDLLKSKLSVRKNVILNELKRARVVDPFAFKNFFSTEDVEENATELNVNKKKPCPTVRFKNKLSANVSEKIALSDTKKLGINFISKINIKPGDVLLVEKAFSSVLLKQRRLTHCAFCYSLNYALIPCNGCNVLMFCGSSCRDNAYNLFHRIECEYVAFAKTVNLPDEMWLCLRTILIATQQGKILNEFLEHSFVKNPFTLEPLSMTKNYASDYAAICNLPDLIGECSNYEILVSAIRAALSLHVLKKSSFFDEVNKESNHYQKKIFGDVTEAESLVGTLILKNFLSLAPIIDENVTECIEIVSASRFDNCSHEMRKIGSAFYPIQARVQKSCYPNVSQICYEDQIVVFAVRPINAGEQIATSHGARSGSCFAIVPLPQRRKLMEALHIKCECDACTHQWPLFSELELFSFKNLPKNAVRKMKKDTEKFHKLLTNPQLIKHELEFLCEYSASLHRFTKKPNKESLACEDALLKAFATQGNYYTAFGIYSYQRDEIANIIFNEMKNIWFPY